MIRGKSAQAFADISVIFARFSALAYCNALSFSAISSTLLEG